MLNKSAWEYLIVINILINLFQKYFRTLFKELGIFSRKIDVI